MYKRIILLIFLTLLCLSGCSWNHKKQNSKSWPIGWWFVNHKEETVYVVPTIAIEDGKDAYENSLFDGHLIIGSEHWDLSLANNLVKNMNLVSADLFSNEVDNWRKPLVVNNDFVLSANSTLPKQRDIRKIKFEQIIIPPQIDALWLTIEVSTLSDSTRKLQSKTWQLRTSKSKRNKIYKRIY